MANSFLFSISVLLNSVLLGQHFAPAYLELLWTHTADKRSWICVAVTCIGALIGVCVLMKDYASKGGIIPFAPGYSKLFHTQRVIMGHEKGGFKPQLLGVRCHAYSWGLYSELKNVWAHVPAGDLAFKINEFWNKEFGHDYFLARPKSFQQVGSQLKALVHGKECKVMSASSYCGIPGVRGVLEQALHAAEAIGPNLGSAAALGVNTSFYELCDTLKTYYKRDNAMVYASGFLACEDILRILCRTHPGTMLILLDAKSHPSLRNGAQFANKSLTYKHNDANDLQRLLRRHKSAYDTVVVAMESVYSTSGDLGPFPDICAVAKKHACLLVVDDAHGFGAIGPNSGGVEDYWNMVGAADIICGTFSKSTSAQGGFVVMNSGSIASTICGSDGVGFASTMNAFNATYAKAAIEHILKNGKEIAKEAAELKSHFIEQLQKKAGVTVDPSPARVFGIKFDGPVKAVLVQEKLIARGFFCSAFCFAAVPFKYSLIRLTIVPGMYTKELIDDFVEALRQAIPEAESSLVPFEKNMKLFC